MFASHYKLKPKFSIIKKNKGKFLELKNYLVSSFPPLSKKQTSESISIKTHHALQLSTNRFVIQICKIKNFTEETKKNSPCKMQIFFYFHIFFSFK